MQRDRLIFKEITDHRLLTEFYLGAGLEINEDWVKDSGVFFSEQLLWKDEGSVPNDIEGGRDESLSCFHVPCGMLAAYSLSRRFGVTVLDYIAVRDDLRKNGIGGLMLDRIKEKCLGFGEKRIYLTAKAGVFFRKNGASEISEGSELYDLLLGECALCDQRGKDCFPAVMVINL